MKQKVRFKLMRDGMVIAISTDTMRETTKTNKAFRNPTENIYEIDMEYVHPEVQLTLVMIVDNDEKERRDN